MPRGLCPPTPLVQSTRSRPRGRLRGWIEDTDRNLKNPKPESQGSLAAPPGGTPKAGWVGRKAKERARMGETIKGAGGGKSASREISVNIEPAQVASDRLRRVVQTVVAPWGARVQRSRCRRPADRAERPRSSASRRPNRDLPARSPGPESRSNGC